MLKISTKGSVYYLVEAREKTGVDEYLPDSGVLITRIDEARQSGEGIVRVMDCHPKTETIDDATCHVNESWEDRANGIYVKVIGEQGTGYVVAIASQPVSIVQVTLSIEPDISGAKVRLDGISYDIQQLPATFIWTIGSEHVLEVEGYDRGWLRNPLCLCRLERRANNDNPHGHSFIFSYICGELQDSVLVDRQDCDWRPAGIWMV